MEETIHHLLASWMQFILDWGYLGIFLMMAFESTAVPIPAEIVIPPAAYWAAQGKLSLTGVILAACRSVSHELQMVFNHDDRRRRNLLLGAGVVRRARHRRPSGTDERSFRP